MNTTVSMLVEVPEPLHDSLKHFLELRPDYEQERVIAAALSLFLLQNRVKGAGVTSARSMARVYLDALFGRKGGEG